MGKIHKVLSCIQTALQAPKTQWNKYSEFYYRNCEDILEGLKPHLKTYEASLLVTDEVIVVEGRFYIKATVTLFVGDEKIVSSAFSREPSTKPKMSEEQVTGSASSYARKYALNGLFCCDDSKDPDSIDNKKPTTDNKKKGYDNNKPKKNNQTKTKNIIKNKYKNKCNTCGRELSVGIEIEYDFSQNKCYCVKCPPKQESNKEISNNDFLNSEIEEVVKRYYKNETKIEEMIEVYDLVSKEEVYLKDLKSLDSTIKLHATTDCKILNENSIKNGQKMAGAEKNFYHKRIRDNANNYDEQLKIYKELSDLKKSNKL